jgi:signal transduction histidine kinase
MILAMLAYARADRRVEPTPFALGEAVADAVKALAPRLQAAQAAVRCEPLPEVLGDRVQLSQVFQNLIGNAVKYRDPGRSPLVAVGGEVHGDAVEVRIADNGLGIPEDSRARIFEPFQRVHGTAGVPGSGIGLAVCKKIVERHGGRIWVESRPGQGSVFRFTLPVRR